MFDIIGETAGNEGFHAGNFSRGTRKDSIIQEAEPSRKTLPTEGPQPGENAKPEGGVDERTRNRTKLEGGDIIIETYAQDGKLVKITPPGYLPFGKIA